MSASMFLCGGSSTTTTTTTTAKPTSPVTTNLPNVFVVERRRPDKKEQPGMDSKSKRESTVMMQISRADSAKARELPGQSLQSDVLKEFKKQLEDCAETRRSRAGSAAASTGLTASPTLLHLLQLGLLKATSSGQRGRQREGGDGNALLRGWSESELDTILGELHQHLDFSTGAASSASRARPAKSGKENSKGPPPPRSSTMPTFPSCVGGNLSQNLKVPEHPPHQHHPSGAPPPLLGVHHRIDSPDNDSAFSDNASMLSSESSASSGRNGHVHFQQQQQQQQQIMMAADENALSKAEKINLALQKLKEASIKKLFVKIFCADGSTQSILVDETMSVSTLLDLLVEKNHIQLDPSWGIVEHLPELYMERCLEDHENVLATLCSWRPEAENKLLFVSRPERYDLFRRPEKYLAGATPVTERWDQQARQALLQDFFYIASSPEAESPQQQQQQQGLDNGSGCRVLRYPEVEGPLWLKAEGKKTWKKFHFIFRPDGIYYMPHVAKSSSKRSSSEPQDLALLAPLNAVQLYLGVGWKKKYKSPTDACFALKPPHVQIKSPKEVRYLCAESEASLFQWSTAVRIAQNQQRLLENYNTVLIKMNTGMGKESLYAAMRQQQQHNKHNAKNQMQEVNLGPNQQTTAMIHSQGQQQYQIPMQQQILANVASSSSLSSTTSGSGNGHNESLPSSNTSVSSGCISETSSISENGFDADIPDGGTIKRKPNGAHNGQNSSVSAEGLLEITNTIQRRPGAMLEPLILSGVTATGNGAGLPDAEGASPRDLATPTNERESSLPPPPPEMLANAAAAASSSKAAGNNGSVALDRTALGGSDLSLNSLPPPPEELKFPLRYPPSQASNNNNKDSGGGPTYIDANSGRSAMMMPPVSSVAPCAGLQQQQQPAIMSEYGPSTATTTTYSLPPGNQLQQLQQQQQQCNNPAGDHQNGGGGAIRESLYPCGVFRSVFPRDQQQQHQAQGGGPANQMDLLKQMPDNPPPRPFQQQHQQQVPSEYGFPTNQLRQLSISNPSTRLMSIGVAAAAALPRRRRITFNEVVQSLGDQHTLPLKEAPPETKEFSRPSIKWIPSSSVRNSNPGRLFEEDSTVKDAPPKAFLNDLQRVMKKKWTVAQKFHAEALPSESKEVSDAVFANHYNEHDVSKWILQSLKHCHITETDMSQDLYDMTTMQQRQQQQHQQSIMYAQYAPNQFSQSNGGQASSTAAAGSMLPPEQRPKIYNGRSVPNCFPPTTTESGRPHQSGPAAQVYVVQNPAAAAPGPMRVPQQGHPQPLGLPIAPMAASSYGPASVPASAAGGLNGALSPPPNGGPAPPRRSQNTQLTSPR